MVVWLTCKASRLTIKNKRLEGRWSVRAIHNGIIFHTSRGGGRFKNLRGEGHYVIVVGCLFLFSLQYLKKIMGWGAMAPRPPLPLHCFQCRLKDKVGQGNKRRNIVIWGAEQLSKNENPQRTHCTIGWNLLWRRNSVTFVYLKFYNSLYLISTIINCC